MRPLEFGWYLPTHGDTIAFNVVGAEIAPSLELFERVVGAAEGAGFEYLLIPVGVACWEAYMAGAYMAARFPRIKPLIAARPGFVNPVMLAKMISTLDQLSKGRVSVNLIAGQNDEDVLAEGVRFVKEERYALMEEEVTYPQDALDRAKGPSISMAVSTSSAVRASARASTSSPTRAFYLGGGSRQAWEISAKHADVHLFWGDYPERLAENDRRTSVVSPPSTVAREKIGFGMRLQIICRETEDDAWAAAEALVAEPASATERGHRPHVRRR